MSALSDDQSETNGSENLSPNLAILFAGSASIAVISFAALPLLSAIASTTLGILMVAGADVDSRTLLLPDTVTWGAIAAGLVAAYGLAPDAPWDEAGAAIMRGVGIGLLLAALAWGYAKIRQQNGVGFGDVKLGVAVGIWLPLDAVPVCFGLAAVAALVAVGLARLRGRAMTAATPIPFGAFLCPALWLTFYASALPA
jgi:leader peptidase (prepilin peptidase)/N-methyltransferase